MPTRFKTKYISTSATCYESDLVDNVSRVDLFAKRCDKMEKAAIKIANGEGREDKWKKLTSAVAAYQADVFTADAKAEVNKAVAPLGKVADQWGVVEKALTKDFISYLKYYYTNKDVEDQCKHMELLRKDTEKAQKNQSKETAGTMEASFNTYKEGVDKLMKKVLGEMEAFKGMCDAWVKTETEFGEVAKKELGDLGSGGGGGKGGKSREKSNE